MRKLLLFAAAIAFAAPNQPDPQALAAQRKIDVIESGKAKPGSVFVFPQPELNAWVRYKLPSIVPEGVSDPRLELTWSTATAYATVNFLKVQHGQGVETNWFISKLIDGDKPVKVIARIESANGKATVHLLRVEISGLAISGSTLDFFIDNFFRPLYPDAKIDEPFELDYNMERIESRPGEARVVIKK